MEYSPEEDDSKQITWLMAWADIVWIVPLSIICSNAISTDCLRIRFVISVIVVEDTITDKGSNEHKGPFGPLSKVDEFSNSTSVD